MKKGILSFILVSLAAVTLCGCKGARGSIIILDGAEPERQAAVTVYGHRCDVYSRGVIEDALQSYMRQSDAVATYECADETEYWTALDKRYQTGNLDDLFMCDYDGILKMAEAGALADLTGTVNENVFNDFARSQLYNADGKIYAAPTGISTYGLYVNYDLLEKEGKQVPRNYSEFEAVCDYFVSKGVTPLVCNNHSSLSSLMLARGMYETYSSADVEGELTKFNANPASLSQPVGDGIDFVYQIIEKGWIDLDEAFKTEHIGGELELFAAGDRPFMISGGWLSPKLKELNKTLSYGIQPYPVLDTTSVLVARTDTLLCVKEGDNADEAKKIVSILTQPEMLTKLTKNQSTFSVLKGQTQIYSDSAIIPSAKYLTKGRYVISGDRNLNVPLDTFLNECSSLILNGGTREAVKAHLQSLLDGVKVK